MTNYGYDVRKQRVYRIICECQNKGELRNALEKYGYNHKKFQEGNDLWENLKKTVVQHTTQHTEYHQAVKDLKKCWNNANKVLKLNIQLARIIIRTRKKLTVPRLCTRTLSRGFDSWQEDAYQFYDFILTSPDWVRWFKEYNIDEKKLIEGKQMVKAAVCARKKKQDLRQIANNSTSRRDEALKKMEMWCSALIAIAKMVLGNHSPHIVPLTHSYAT